MRMRTRRRVRTRELPSVTRRRRDEAFYAGTRWRAHQTRAMHNRGPKPPLVVNMILAGAVTWRWMGPETPFERTMRPDPTDLDRVILTDTYRAP